jgi:hypothetical protein
MPQNTPTANKHYRNARKAIQRLANSSRKDQTTLTIINHLKAAIAADGGN